jgi:cytochrome P450
MTEPSLLEQLSTLPDEAWGGSNPLSMEFRDNPYPGLRALQKNDPVNLTPLGVWRLTKYDDITKIMKSSPVAMTLSDGGSPSFDPLDTRGDFHKFMLNMDGPEHLRLRRLVIKAFTGKAVKLMEYAINEAVDNAIEKGLAQGGMDICEDLAVDLPSRMICRIMGIPESDRLIFQQWAGERTKAFWARFLPETEQVKIRDAGAALSDYFDQLVKERRKDPKDDLLSELIRAEDEGDRLHEGELVIQAIGLLVAAYETTTGLIGNGLLAFIKHPGQRALLLSDSSLLGNAVDECLRYDTPILFNWRVLREATEVRGKILPADSVLWLMLGAGNRDPDRFDDPNSFDITRSDITHLSFGGGSHYCLGNQFARMEGRAAIGGFLDRVPKIRLIEERMEWSNSFFRVLAKLPVEFI